MYRDKVAMVVLATIAIGALAGSTLMSDVQHKHTDTTEMTQLSPPIVAQQPLTEAMEKPQFTVPPNTPTTESDLDSLSQELDSTIALGNQYLEEIAQLRSRNASLHEESRRVGRGNY